MVIAGSVVPGNHPWFDPESMASLRRGQWERTVSGWWCNNHLEKYEFVNGKDDIPYIIEKNMFETTNQVCLQTQGILKNNHGFCQEQWTLRTELLKFGHFRQNEWEALTNLAMAA
jgi:hypothetical protein